MTRIKIEWKIFCLTWLYAMCPNIENVTQPAKRQVPVLTKQVIIASLKILKVRYMKYVGNIHILKYKIRVNVEIFATLLTQYNYDGIYCKIQVQVVLQCQLNRQRIFGLLNLSKFLNCAICSSRVLCTENVINE